jgi:hypothetical protein
MKIKVPFKHWKLLVEKEIEFVFSIATLEEATEGVLKCDLWEVDTQNPYDVNVAILFAGYLVACQKAYKKPKYKLEHAIFWTEHMSKSSQEMFLKAVKDLLGKLSKGGEKKK